jgi:hypothetical protein
VVEVATWFRDRDDRYRFGGAIAERPKTAKGGDPQADLLSAFEWDPDWALQFA